MSIRPFRVEIEDLGGQLLLLTKYRWWRPFRVAKVSWSQPPGYNPQFFWVNDVTGGGASIDYHNDRPYYKALEKWHKKRSEKEKTENRKKKKAQHEQYMKSVLKPVKKTAKLPEAKVHKP
jgi:hypothetical protein